jgi:hypothetical protein
MFKILFFSREKVQLSWMNMSKKSTEKSASMMNHKNVYISQMEREDNSVIRNRGVWVFVRQLYSTENEAIHTRDIAS